MEHPADKRLRRLEALRRDCSSNPLGAARLAVQFIVLGALGAIIATAPVLGFVAALTVLSATFATKLFTSQRRIRTLIDIEIDFANETRAADPEAEQHKQALTGEEAAAILGVEPPPRSEA